MTEIPAISPTSYTALRTRLTIMVFSKEHNAVPPILKSEAEHVPAALLLAKKPLNLSFESRFALRQAYFRLLTILIPRVVNNHAPKISNTYKLQPKVQIGCLVIESRGRYRSTLQKT
jgi:hypothetical protein